jgi:hypothetical protein
VTTTTISTGLPVDETGAALFPADRQEEAARRSREGWIFVLGSERYMAFVPDEGGGGRQVPKTRPTYRAERAVDNRPVVFQSSRPDGLLDQIRSWQKHNESRKLAPEPVAEKPEERPPFKPITTRQQAARRGWTTTKLGYGYGDTGKPFVAEKVFPDNRTPIVITAHTADELVAKVDDYERQRFERGTS